MRQREDEVAQGGKWRYSGHECFVLCECISNGLNARQMAGGRGGVAERGWVEWVRRREGRGVWEWCWVGALSVRYLAAVPHCNASPFSRMYPLG